MYYVYPEGFNPEIAYGLPNENHLRYGIKWTEDNVKSMRELAKLGEWMEEPPLKRWYDNPKGGKND